MTERADAAPPPQVHRELVVDAQCPRRLAVAFARYRSSRPSFALSIVVDLVLIVLFAVIGQWIVVTVLAVLLVVLLGAAFATVNRMERLLSQRGYRPGTTVTVDYWADRFEVTTAVAKAPYLYSEISGLSVRAGVVTICTHSRNLIILLPEPLVPDEVRPLLGSTR